MISYTDYSAEVLNGSFTLVIELKKFGIILLERGH